jgi:hypothetical protein
MPLSIFFSSRLFQKRSSLRVKNLLELKKIKNTSGENTVSTDDENIDKQDTKIIIKESESKIISSEVRKKLKLDRALRAQRRLEAK